MSDPDSKPAGPAPPTGWEKLNAQLTILDNVAKFLLVTLLGTFAKCSVDDYTRNMERTKRVDDVTTALSTQDTDKDVTKRNLTLVTLDRLYSRPRPHWWQRLLADSEQQADDSLLFNIAEEVYRARMATTVKPEETTQARVRLNLAARIMTRRDPKRAAALLDCYKTAAETKTRSTADTLALTTGAPASLPIAPGNKVLLEPTVTTDAAGKVAAKPLCYIQFRGFERSVARQLQQLFQQRGWNAPGVERVPGNYGCSVRYYFAEDAAKADTALKVTRAFLNKQPGAPPVSIISLVQKKLEGKVPHGQIELWISPGSRR